MEHSSSGDGRDHLTDRKERRSRAAVEGIASKENGLRPFWDASERASYYVVGLRAWDLGESPMKIEVGICRA